MSEKRWLDGPGFVEWLDPFLDYPNLPENLKRRVRSYRAGGLASMFVADEILCHTEVSLWDVPDELWGYGRQGCEFPEDVRDEAVKRVEAGEQIASVASSLGANRNTVSLWVKKGVAA